MNAKNKLFRISLIVLVVAAVGWFGLRFGPEPRSAEAKIFERLINFTKAMPAYRFNETTSSTPRKTSFNGNTTYLSVSQSRDSISSILNFYENAYPSTPLRPIDEEIVEKIVGHAEDQELKESVQVLADFLKCFNGNFRQERRDWGLWGSFELFDKSLEIGSDAYIKAMRKTVDSGNLGELGTARIVIAIKDPDSGLAKILNIWNGRDFNINNFLPDPFGDVAGKDIEDVPRYPNSRRVLSLEQENEGTTDTIVAYEGGGSVASTVLFYRSRMRQAGWETDAIFEEAARKNSRQDLLFYTRGNRECTIQIHKDKSIGATVTLVVDRTTRST